MGGRSIGARARRTGVSEEQAERAGLSTARTSAAQLGNRVGSRCSARCSEMAQASCGKRKTPSGFWIVLRLIGLLIALLILPVLIVLNLLLYLVILLAPCRRFLARDHWALGEMPSLPIRRVSRDRTWRRRWTLYVRACPASALLRSSRPIPWASI